MPRGRNAPSKPQSAWTARSWHVSASQSSPIVFFVALPPGDHRQRKVFYGEKYPFLYHWYLYIQPITTHLVGIIYIEKKLLVCVVKTELCDCELLSMKRKWCIKYLLPHRQNPPRNRGIVHYPTCHSRRTIN